MAYGNGHVRYTMVIICIVCFSLPNGSDLSLLRFESFRSEVLPGYYKYMNLDLTNYAHGMMYGGCFAFLQEIQNFDVTFECILRTKGKRSLNLLNATYNGCTLIQSIKNMDKKNVIRKIIAGVNHAKFPKTCPMKADTEFCFSNFSADGLDFPIYLPEVNAEFNFFLSQKKDTFYKGFFKLKGV
uniref:Uncharacterized protein n=1 Tax=Stomoxys calcitrans TaxID=35570 RepID=A0A1I8PQ80_STOCA